jgi:CRP-like cAMP-binding protein
MAQRRDAAPVPVLQCRDCATRRSAEWRVLSDPDVERLSRAKLTGTHAAGAVVFKQDSPCEGIHCLAAGSLMLRKRDARGHAVLVGLVAEGRTVGYRSYYNNHWHAEQAETLEPSTICLVPSATVQALLAANPALGDAFSLSLADDLKRIEQALLDSVARPLRARIALLLQALLERFGEADEAGRIELRLPFTREEIAGLLAVQRETVTRALNAMQADGVLQISGRTLLIHDLDQLLDELERE